MSATNGVIKLKKGYDIKIAGKAKKEIKEVASSTFALKPIDFHGIAPIPKMVVSVGQEVKTGDHIFFDKNNPTNFYTAPVSGEIIEIRRGPKRAVHEVVILADKEIQYRNFEAKDPGSLNRDAIVAHLKDSGCWNYIRQRPFEIHANPEDAPKAILITGFDSAPLAPSYGFTLSGRENDLQTGIEALSKLTEGKVYLSLNANGDNKVFDGLSGVKKVSFKGPHPSGTVGVQMHHIDPINKGEIIWHMDAHDVATIGRLFSSGKYDPVRIVALGGPEVNEPIHFKTRQGASIKEMVDGNLNSDHVRLVAGNVLTGRQVEKNSHLGFFDRQVTVLEEGDDYEFLGWLIPGKARPSISPTFLSTVTGKKEFVPTTNTHGEGRAFVMTGQYESVLPMNILPQHLLKSILMEDFDLMEGLGIYEVAEDDLAICEFVCTSKQPVQAILRHGLDLIREQG